MKTLRTLLVIAVAIFGFSAVSFGQTTSTVAAAPATATVLTPIVLTNPQPLIFGTFVSDATSPYTVILGMNDDRSASTAQIYEIGALAKTAIFHVVGTPDATFAFTLPTGLTTLTGPSAHTLTILAADWITNLGDNSVLTSTLSSGGIYDLYIGTTLQVPANRAAGNYSGTYAISVNYN